MFDVSASSILIVLGPSIVVGAAVIVNGIISYRSGRLAQKAAEEAAGRVAEVKATLLKARDSTEAKLDSIHVLVNNQLSQAVERFEAALKEIETLKTLLKESHQREVDAKR